MCVNNPNPDSLFFCSILTVHNCTHAEDVGVSCPTIRKFQFALCDHVVTLRPINSSDCPNSTSSVMLATY